ncbi:hypothetical protein OROHE_009935 [Orobanche hederae]
MLVRDLVSWNTVVDSFAKAGKMGLAHELFDKVPEECGVMEHCDYRVFEAREYGECVEVV